MDKSKFHILVVEDDATQGPALLAAFERAGFAATLCKQPTQALAFAQHTEFHCLFVDCMLPGMNGVDLTRELLKLAHRLPTVFLSSGIFKDKSFIKEAMDKTSAAAFFIKPLEIPEILKMVEEALSAAVTDAHPIPLLPKLYAREPFSHHSMMEFLNSETTLHAFHLPKLYQRMADTDLSGTLRLFSGDAQAAEITFHDGQVCAVRTHSGESLFGGIAISFGFVAPEDVAAASADKSKKMIGQKLIDSMAVSPHAIKVILEEQMALRLSQTLRDEVLSLEWEMKNVSAPEMVLAATRFQQLCADWLESKMTSEWIRETLAGWGHMPLDGHLRASLRESKNLGELLQNPGFKDPHDLIAVFAGLLFGKLHLGHGTHAPGADFGFLAARIGRLELNARTQNYFQFLGISEKSHQRDLNKAYEGFKISLTPESLPAGCPPELIERAAAVLATVEKAYATLASEIERPRYIAMLSNKRLQEAIESEPLFREAIGDIIGGQYKSAAAKFKSLSDRKIEIRDLRSYRLLVGLRLDRNFNDLQFDHVPPEERHSPAYLVARGVFYQLKGQAKKALDSYRAAHAMDPDLGIARLEVKNLGFELDKNRSANRELLKEIVIALQGMPKGGRRQSA